MSAPIFVILGKYKSKNWEEIDNAETRQEIEYLLGEYRLSFGKDWLLKIIRKVEHGSIMDREMYYTE